VRHTHSLAGSRIVGIDDVVVVGAVSVVVISFFEVFVVISSSLNCPRVSDS
jgi:hypothetical protein